MTARTRVWVLVACLLATACGDPERQLELPQLISPPMVVVDPGHQTTKECDGASQGAPCGKAGSAMHCVFDVCVRNICGDGVANDWEAEECDDGNQRDHDGCDSRCKTEPPPGCGNGTIEAREACDDGNAADDDGCTHLCTTARCGDRIVSRGEECDDGNVNEQDGCTRRCRSLGSAGGAGGTAGGPGGSAGGTTISGSGAGEGGSNNSSGGGGSAGHSGSGTAGARAGFGGTAGGLGGNGGLGGMSAGVGGASAGRGGTAGGFGGAGGAGTSAAGGGGSSAAGSGGDAACTACRLLNCADYMGSGLNVYAGCLLAVDGSQGADTSDPTFIQDCIDVVNCAFQNDCAYGLGGANPCYCGSATPDVCIPDGPAPDAKCVAQYQAAARSSVNDDVTSRVSDFAYPLAWANFLLECDRDSCSTATAGKCTP